MLKKLMIRTWRGTLPPWTTQFRASVSHLSESGWDFAIIDDWLSVRRRIQANLYITIPQEIDTRKPGDYDPANSIIFADLIKGYDFWGHFNLDCVYGRLSHWLPDSFLSNIDIYGNDPGAVCGPFTLYRNCEKVNNLFQSTPDPEWHYNASTSRFLGWDEGGFSDHVRQSALRGDIRFASGFLQAHDHMTPKHYEFADSLIGNYPVKFNDDGALIDNVTDQEIMMYHFNQTRRWPCG